jgi:hypothetical protein
MPKNVAETPFRGDPVKASPRRRRVWAGLVIVALVAVGTLAGRFYYLAQRPNVLLITLDTTRSDRIGCYGYEQALTPTLDALAAEGVLFERAYTPAPLTRGRETGSCSPLET